MNLVDYTGKLNNHKSYLEILHKIEPQCKYIEIVIIAEGMLEDNEIANRFKDDIQKIEIVSKWWGTETVCKNKLVRIKASAELFNYLRKFETFCKFYCRKEYIAGIDRCVAVQESTDFGQDDIAFYDDKDNILLCTTTHECYISISKNLI